LLCECSDDTCKYCTNYEPDYYFRCKTCDDYEVCPKCIEKVNKEKHEMFGIGGNNPNYYLNSKNKEANKIFFLNCRHNMMYYTLLTWSFFDAQQKMFLGNSLGYDMLITNTP